MSEPRTEGGTEEVRERQKRRIFTPLLLLLLLLLGPPANVRPSLTMPALSPAFVYSGEGQGGTRGGIKALKQGSQSWLGREQCHWWHHTKCCNQQLNQTTHTFSVLSGYVTCHVTSHKKCHMSCHVKCHQGNGIWKRCHVTLQNVMSDYSLVSCKTCAMWIAWLEKRKKWMSSTKAPPQLHQTSTKAPPWERPESVTAVPMMLNV